MFTLIKIYKTVYLIPIALVDQPVALDRILSINVSPDELPTHAQVNEYILANSASFNGVDFVYYLAETTNPNAAKINPWEFKLFVHVDVVD